MLTFAHASQTEPKEENQSQRPNPAKTYGHFFRDGAFLLVAQIPRKNYALVELVQQLSSRISLGGEITHVGLHDVVDPAPALFQ